MMTVETKNILRIKNMLPAEIRKANAGIEEDGIYNQTGKYYSRTKLKLLVTRIILNQSSKIGSKQFSD